MNGIAGGGNDLRIGYFWAADGTKELKAGPGADLDPPHVATTFYENCFAGSYVIPYNTDYFQNVCGGQSGPISNFFLYPLKRVLRPASGQNGSGQSDPLDYTFASEADVVIPSAWNGTTWGIPGLTLRFPENRKLIVEGDLTASGVTFTASDPAYGWRGIRFEPGASGVLEANGLDRTSIDQVAGYDGDASVYVHDASVSLDGVDIDGREQQPADYDLEVSAVHATGMQASVGVSNFSEITLHTGGGIEATFGATV